MNFRLKSLIIFVSLLTLFSPSFGLYAADSDFNPNYILSDEELQDYTTMNRADIQAFLQEYGSWLVSHNTPDAEGVNRTASDIIYRAAITHKINPKYLLVKLQKEQSLITDPSPAQKQLDWATGYGICDSCSLSDPALQKHKGFGVQVDSAAAIMRWYYDNLNREVWIKTTGQTYLVDNIIVRPATFYALQKTQRFTNADYAGAANEVRATERNMIGKVLNARVYVSTLVRAPTGGQAENWFCHPLGVYYCSQQMKTNAAQFVIDMDAEMFTATHIYGYAEALQPPITAGGGSATDVFNVLVRGVS